MLVGFAPEEFDDVLSKRASASLRANPEPKRSDLIARLEEWRALRGESQDGCHAPLKTPARCARTPAR